MLSKSQLLWRCRRGVRELDILMTRFVESDFEQMDQASRADFERLLDVQDPIIMDWIFERAEPSDSGLANIINRLKEINCI